MKKTIMAIVMASVLALCAVACSNDDSAADTTLGASESVVETAAAE